MVRSRDLEGAFRLSDPVEYACSLPIRDGKILLGMRAAHRRSWPSCWDTIGGHVETGESPDAALVRELQEELGVTPTVFEPLGTIEAMETDGKTPALWRMFAVTAWTGGEPRIANDEHTELAWFAPDDIQSLHPLASDAYRPFIASLRGWILER